MKSKVKAPNIEQLPSGSFRARVMINSKRYSITGESPADVVSKYYTLIAGGKIEENHRKHPEQMTIGECIDRYIDSRRISCSPATIRAYIAYRKNAFPEIMHRVISGTSDDVFQKAIRSSSKSHSGKTIRNQWCLVSSAIKDATGREINVQLPPVVANEHEFLAPEQIPVFLEELKKEKVDVQIAALLGLHSLRRSEIVDVTWDDIDLVNGIIHVRGAAVYDENWNLVHKATNKTNKSRRDIPIMIDDLRVLLESVQDKSGYVVKIVPQTIHKSVNRICERTGLPRIGVHGLRHSFASLAYHTKMPAEIARRLGGWTGETMNKVYTHVGARDMADATKAFADFFK